MIKSTAFLFLALTLVTNAFAPSPAFGARRVVMPLTPSKNVVFMASPATEEVTEMTPTEAVNGANVSVAEIPIDAVEEKEELTETQKLMKQVKESGTAGVVSYALWELAFWLVSVPVCVFGYREVTG